MPTEVPNRVAVVTGASRSIGKGIALELGAAGATGDGYIRKPNNYRVYFDPEGKASNEYELYDLERAPDEVDHLLGVRTGEPKGAAAGALRSRMAERLADSMVAHGTEPRSAAS